MQTCHSSAAATQKGGKSNSKGIKQKTGEIENRAEPKEPSGILQISGFTNNDWGWRHQITNQLPVGFTEQFLYLIKSLQK